MRQLAIIVGSGELDLNLELTPTARLDTPFGRVSAQPRSAETVRTLLERHQASSFRITIPTHGGKGGHPIFIAAELLPELADIDEETQGLKAVVRRHADATERFEVDDATVLWDLNTPEQYQQAVDSGF